MFVTGRRGPAKTRGPALIPRPAPLPSTRCPAPFERGRGADKRSKDLSEIAIHTPYYVIHTPRATFFYLAKVISPRIDAAHGPTPRRGPPLGQGDRAKNRPRPTPGRGHYPTPRPGPAPRRTLPSNYNRDLVTCDCNALDNWTRYWRAFDN